MAEEKNFENRIKDFLVNKGAWFIKYWAGAKFTKEGIPDILACVNGYFYGIEVKAKNGKPKLIQLVTLRKIREAGGIGLLLYPKDIENFKSFVTRHPLNNDWYKENIRLQEDWFNKLNA